MRMNVSLLPISASRLRRRTVQHGRRRIRAVSFFPFFERTGRMRRIMVITRDSSEIYSLPPGEFLPRVAVFGRVQVPERVTLFDPIRRADLSELRRLWHYDPWWVLDEERFLGHWAREQLKQTNCVTQSGKKLVGVYYRGDLSRAQWAVYREDGGSISVSGWNELRLPERPPTREPLASRKPSALWILDPIWNRR